ncbi:phage integrase SAM-like domain-containing protein [Brevibacillus daliensis]|uniref:phage integrase SAM-like domain-containing protein n=1 Tax=Brevibacillus daliensis TaxID=2892995 RepID=UPI001E39A92F|nr:phage integrase SAM-like domain-containing protein [Brevibacillus daliensis]
MDILSLLFVNFPCPKLGSLKLSQLTPTHIQKFYNELSAEGLSPDYIRYMHSILRKSIGQAVKWQLVARNVVELVEPPRLADKDIVTWSLEESSNE